VHSALYHGWLEHRRLSPRRHAFRYRLFMVYLDLAELEDVFRGRWLWSTRRAALARFNRRDYLDGSGQPLDEAVRALVAERTGRRPEGPIRLLTHLRYFGYVFNPVSFYYCFDESGRSVETVVAEVTNTPWGERHCYVLQNDGRDATQLRAHSAKAMHVSPFNPMELRYDWRLRPPAEALCVNMALTSTAGGAAPIFGASLMLRRVPINGASLAGTLLRFPLMTAKVIAGIHWQALKLWVKRVPVYDHPTRSRTAARAPTITRQHLP
jgi:uncharacterized protein